MKWPAITVALSGLLLGTASAQRPGPERAAATEDDYRTTLQRLGLAGLRPGANGQDPTAPNAVNYDESKVATVVLPPLLPGSSVKRSPATWRHRRRELLTTFESEMYGRIPVTAPVIRWE